MSTLPQPTVATQRSPRVLRLCQRCQRETPHEIHTASGVSVTICMPCLERALNYEMERD